MEQAELLNPRSIESRVSSFLLYAWPLMLGLPQIVSGEGSRRILTVILYLAIGFMLVFTRRIVAGRSAPASTMSIMLACSLVTLLVMNVLSVFRAPDFASDASVGFALTLIGMAAFMTLSFDDPENVELMRRRVTALLMAPALFIAVNMVLYLLIGRERLVPDAILDARLINYNSLLEIVGLHIPRLSFFPALSGSNSIGSLSALGLFFLFVLFGQEWRGERRVGVLATLTVIGGINGLALLLAESRAIMIWLVLFLGCYILLSTRWLSIISKALLAFSVASPIVLLKFFDYVGSTSAANLFSRGTAIGAAGLDLGVGTGRPIVWRAALARLAEFDVTQLYGYGFYGHFTAGVGDQLTWSSVVTRAASSCTT